MEATEPDDTKSDVPELFAKNCPIKTIGRIHCDKSGIRR